MELAFREWVKEQELSEADFWKRMKRTYQTLPRNPRELAYSLVNLRAFPWEEQKRRAYNSGQSAALNDAEHGTQSENPFRNRSGSTAPEDEPLFKAWEEGYASRKQKTGAPLPAMQQTGQ